MVQNPYDAQQVESSLPTLPWWQNAAFILSAFCLAATVLGHSLLLAAGINFGQLPGGVILPAASVLGMGSGLLAGRGRRWLCVAGNASSFVIPVLLCAPPSFWLS